MSSLYKTRSGPKSLPARIRHLLRKLPINLRCIYSPFAIGYNVRLGPSSHAFPFFHSSHLSSHDAHNPISTGLLLPPVASITKPEKPSPLVSLPPRRHTRSYAHSTATMVVGDLVEEASAIENDGEAARRTWGRWYGKRRGGGGRQQRRRRKLDLEASEKEDARARWRRSVRSPA